MQGAFVTLSLLALSSCASTGPATAWERVKVDAFVLGTAPLQVPVMAVRDAATVSDQIWVDVVAFPVTLPAFLVWHSTLGALHGLDLTATPLHLFNDLQAPQIYEPYQLPMGYVEDADIPGEVGEILLWGAGMWGGAAGAYYFSTEYLPRALTLPGS